MNEGNKKVARDSIGIEHLMRPPKARDSIGIVFVHLLALQSLFL